MVEGDDAHRIRLGLSACHEPGRVGGGGRNPNTVHLADIFGGPKSLDQTDQKSAVVGPKRILRTGGGGGWSEEGTHLTGAKTHFLSESS